MGTSYFVDTSNVAMVSDALGGRWMHALVSSDPETFRVYFGDISFDRLVGNRSITVKSLTEHPILLVGSTKYQVSSEEDGKLIDWKLKKNNLLLRSKNAPGLITTMVAIAEGQAIGKWNHRAGVSWHLTDRLGVWRMDASRFVKQLENQGYVRCTRRANRAFAWKILLTADGMFALAAMKVDMFKILSEIDDIRLR